MASALELIFSRRLDGRRDIQSVKSARSILHAELETCVLHPLYGNHKECKTNTDKADLVVYINVFRTKGIFNMKLSDDNNVINIFYLLTTVTRTSVLEIVVFLITPLVTISII